MDARLYAYLLKHTREPEVLRALRVETAALRGSQMQVPPEQGALLFTLCAMLRATHVVEIGTFTGYSSVAVALALPHDGTLTACDVSEPSFEVARAYWERAGVRGKIVERLGDAQATLDAMLAGDDDDDGDDDGDGAGGEKINHRGRYDFAFVDADKRGYWAYYEKLLELVRPGGVIAIDNVLWYGKVADPEVNDKQTIAIREFNEKVARDERISAHVTVPIGDGLTLCVVR